MVNFANTDALASAKGRVPPSQGNEHPLPRSRNSALLHAEMPDQLAGFMTQDEFGKLVTAINLHIKSAKADISEAKWVCCLPILGCCIYPVKVGGVKTRLGRNITKIIKKHNAAWKESGRGLELRCATYSNNAYLSIITPSVPAAQAYPAAAAAPVAYPQANPAYSPGQQQNYAQAQPAYPPAQQGYPQAQQGYPQAQQGYPQAQQGYPQAQQASYPPQQQSYPVAQPYAGGAQYPPAGSPYNQAPGYGAQPAAYPAAYPPATAPQYNNSPAQRKY